MATVTKKNTNDPRTRLGATPWGNLAALTYGLTTTAAGAVVGSDAAPGSATASGTVIRLGVIPAGHRLVDYKSVFTTKMTNSVTFKMGFEYVDGVDSAEVPQNDAYFAAASTATTVGLLRQGTAVKQVTLPKDAYLVMTTGGAANTEVSAAEFTVFAIADGVQ